MRAPFLALLISAALANAFAPIKGSGFLGYRHAFQGNTLCLFREIRAVPRPD
jgi:hypothetical protein